MFNQIFNKKRLAGRGVYKQYATLEIGGPRAVGRMVAALRQMVLVTGLTAICTLALMFFKPNLADDILALSPYANRSNDDALTTESQWSRLTRSMAQSNTVNHALVSMSSEMEDRVIEGSPIERKRVTEWISKRYRVANAAADMMVTEAYSAAVETNLDPLLILSVIAIESRFNPIAESPVGAQGLMQVMSKVHRERFDDHGGVKAALNPVANIKVGSQILKEYVSRGGSVEAGLKSYVGAAMHRTDGGYGAKVLSEYRRLKLVAGGKSVPITAKAIQQAKSTTAQSGEVDATEEDETVASADAEKTEKSM